MLLRVDLWLLVRRCMVHRLLENVHRPVLGGCRSGYGRFADFDGGIFMTTEPGTVLGGETLDKCAFRNGFGSADALWINLLDGMLRNNTDTERIRLCRYTHSQLLFEARRWSADAAPH